jgi:hypothetical protein
MRALGRSAPSRLRLPENDVDYSITMKEIDQNPYESNITVSSNVLRKGSSFWTSVVFGLFVGVVSRLAFGVLEKMGIGFPSFPILWFFVAGLLAGCLKVEGFGWTIGVTTGYVFVFVGLFVNDSLFPANLIISLFVALSSPIGWLLAFLLVSGIEKAISGSKK